MKKRSGLDAHGLLDLPTTKGTLRRSPWPLYAQPLARNDATLTILRDGHSIDDSHEICGDRENVAKTRLADPAAEGPSRRRSGETPFDPEDICTTTMHVFAQRGADPRGVGQRHLRAAFWPRLVDDIVAFEKTVSISDGLPNLFWSSQTSATRTALGDKVPPVTWCNVVRRLIGGTLCR